MCRTLTMVVVVGRGGDGLIWSTTGVVTLSCRSCSASAVSGSSGRMCVSSGSSCLVGGGVGGLGLGGGVGSGVFSPSALHSTLPVSGHSEIGLGGLSGSTGGSSSVTTYIQFCYFFRNLFKLTIFILLSVIVIKDQCVS